MTHNPPLGPRALASYRRLRVEIEALRGVLDYRKPSGAMGDATIASPDSVLHRANKLFCRHADLPWFPRLDATTLSQADFAILVARLAAALRQFEALHADQLAPWPEDDDDDFDDTARRPVADDLPSPHI